MVSLLKLINHPGQSLIELIIVMGLSAVLLPALLTGLIASRSGRPQVELRSQAVNLMNEADEALASIRDEGWVNLPASGIFHPLVSGSLWTLVAGSESIGDFTRSVEIFPVNRNASGRIVSSGGTLDPSTKKAVITVTWNTVLPSWVATTIYLTRYKDNLTHPYTSQADFDQGIYTGTASTNVSGGEVVLGGGGHGDWCKPNLNLTTVNLDKSGVANALTAIEGQAFAGTGENAAGPSFDNVLISNDYPPAATVSGSFDGFKTNGIFGEAGYAYLTTDTNGKQGEIISLTNLNPVTKKYTEAGYLDIQTSSANGQSIIVANNLAYLSATNSKIYIFDVTNRTGSHTPLTSITLSATANKIAINGNNLYAAVNSTSNQLQIIPLTNSGKAFGTPVDISVAGQAGRDIYINSDASRAYLATAASATQAEMFIVDINPASSNYKKTLSSYDTSGMDPKGVTVVTNNKAIIVGHGGVEYQVVDIANDVITSCSPGLNIDTGVNGIASVVETDGDAYSYIITGDSASELKIIEGGPSGRISNAGVYESYPFDPLFQTAFNRFDVNASVPNQTSLSYQVAVAQPVSGSCTGSTYEYIGPGGTTNPADTFATSSAIPLITTGHGYQNPGQCFRFKAYFTTTNPSSTAVLYDFTVNYSP